MPSSPITPALPERPRILVVSECLPRPDESAGSSRFLAMLTHLARMGAVDLWVERDESEGPLALPTSRVAADRLRLESLGVNVLPATWRAFRATVKTERYDAVLIEFYHVAIRYLPALRGLLPNATLIVDSVDVHFARLDEGVRLGAVHPQWARDVRTAETAVYRAADVIITASTDDATVLGRERGMPPVVCVPTCATPRPRTRRQRSPEAVFVGHFRHDPNLDGVTWFVNEIWPGVRARHPAARLTVIGSYPTRAVHALGETAGVTVLGYVPDLEPHLDRAAVAIAPLRFGAGMKGKVTDAMAAGLPVVTTTIGAQGLDLVGGRHAWIADDADAFAEALAAAFDDQEGSAAMGLVGQAHIADICGAEAVAASLRALLALPRRAMHAKDRTSFLGTQWRLTRLALTHWWSARARRQASRLTSQQTGHAGKIAGQT